MISKFIVACHVSTIPKSPPKIIRENTYTGSKKSQFFYTAYADKGWCAQSNDNTTLK